MTQFVQGGERALRHYEPGHSPLWKETIPVNFELNIFFFPSPDFKTFNSLLCHLSKRFDKYMGFGVI